jgi:hypothetical protein
METITELVRVETDLIFSLFKFLIIPVTRYRHVQQPSFILLSSELADKRIALVTGHTKITILGFSDPTR